MCKREITEEQIIATLAEQERGMGTAAMCRRPGTRSAIFDKWKARFGGLDVSGAWRLKMLETGNMRLKTLLTALWRSGNHRIG